MPRLLHLGVVLLAAAAAFAQTSKPGGDQSKQDATVAPDDFVVMITGACQTPPGEFAVRDCVRGVTREEFEALLAITKPDAPEAYKERLAQTLGQVIVLSNEAKKRGLPKDPEVAELLKFSQLQELAKLVVTYGMKKEQTPGDEEVQKFYEAHRNDYEVADFQRIIVPAKSSEATDEDKAYAETLRTRCAAGEDMNKLQAEANQRVDRPAAPPVDLKSQRRAMYPTAQQALIFDLKRADCAVVAQSKAEFFVFKLLTKSEEPTAEVRPMIVTALEQAKVKAMTEELAKQNVISLNPKYFPPATPPAEKPATSTPK